MTCGAVGPLEECPECGRVLTNGKTGGHAVDCSRYPGRRLLPSEAVVDFAESAPRSPYAGRRAAEVVE